MAAAGAGAGAGSAGGGGGFSFSSFSTMFNSGGKSAGAGQQGFGYASAAMNVAKPWVKYEQLRKTASGLHDDYKELMKRANQALEQGWQMAMDIRREGAEVLGEQSAVFGKSGTTMEGSPLFVEADTKRKIELNAARVIEQAWLEFLAIRYNAKKVKKASKAASKAAEWQRGGAIVSSVGAIVGGIFGGGAGAEMGSQAGEGIGSLGGADKYG